MFHIAILSMLGVGAPTLFAIVAMHIILNLFFGERQ